MEWGKGALIRRGLGVVVPGGPRLALVTVSLSKLTAEELEATLAGTGPDPLLPPAKAPGPSAPPYGRAEEHHFLYSLRDSSP